MVQKRSLRLVLLMLIPIVLFAATAIMRSWQPRTLTVNGTVMGVDFSPDGKLLATASDNATQLWDVQNGHLLHVAQGGGNSVSFSHDGKYLADGSTDYKVRLWDLKAMKIVRTVLARDSSECLFSPDDKMLAVWCRNRPLDECHLWNLQTRKTLLLPPNPRRNFSRAIHSAAFSPDGKLIATGGSYWTKQGVGEVRVWDTKTGKLLHTLKQQWPANSIAFSPDGTLLASTDRNTLRFWKVATGRLQTTWSNFSAEPALVRFSPDGKQLAVAIGNSRASSALELRDAQTGAVQRTLQGHKGVVRSIDYSSDGSMLATGSWDQTIKLWRLK